MSNRKQGRITAQSAPQYHKSNTSAPTIQQRIGSIKPGTRTRLASLDLQLQRQ